MKNKILIIVFVPLIERQFDIYIPETKKIGTVKNLIIKIIEEQNPGTFSSKDIRHLYDKDTGELLDDNLFVRNSKIENGSKIIMY